MRFAIYEHQHRTCVAVLGVDDVLHPVPGVRSLTELIGSGQGLNAMLDAGASALELPPGPHVSDVRLLSPLLPSSVRDLVTFEEHVEGVRRSVSGER